MLFLPLLHTVRRTLALLDFVIFTLFMYLLSFLPTSIQPLYRILFRFWCKSFIDALDVQLFVHEKYQGTLPEKYILIANHPSAFEDIGMLFLFNVRFLAKRELKDWWILGRIATAAGTLYVKREDKESRAAALHALHRTLQAGESIGLYPEGGCFGRRIHIPFHANAFDVAIKTNTPVVPLFLYYEAQASFEWQGQSLLQKLWQIGTSPNRRVNYYIFDPVKSCDFSSKEALTAHLEQCYLRWQKQYLE